MASGLAIGAVLVLGVLGPPGLSLSARPICALASGMSHAAVMVTHSDGHSVSACVAFGGASIGGGDLMRLSGIEYTSAYNGAAVCQIDNEPNPSPDPCFSSSRPFWALFYARGPGGRWVVSSGQGFTGLQFSDGDALGWRYDTQSGGCPEEATCPVPASPATVCAARPAEPPVAIAARPPQQESRAIRSAPAPQRALRNYTSRTAPGRFGEPAPAAAVRAVVARAAAGSLRGAVISFSLAQLLAFGAVAALTLLAVTRILARGGSR